MKRRTLITPLTGWLVLTLAPIHAVNAADTSAADAMVRQNGNITGRVINAATTTGLEGADVALEGTIYSARTERDGTYQLQAPTGNYTLTVSYTGLDTQNIPVSIQPGATARQDVGLTAAIYKLGAFVVSGEREGKALAITLQRQAPNVKSVVAADALGVLNGNPGELLKRLPGVMGLDTGGETRFVSIRGMAAALNTVTVDGNRMANAGSAGTSRDFQMQTMVSEGIERMEVVKSPTPDMDGDSIGGAVNFVSATAFDRAAGRRLSGAWGATNRPADKRDQKIHQDYSIAYSEVFWGKLGVTLNYGKHQQLSSISSVTRQYERKATDPAYIYSFALNDFTNLRTRWGGNLRLDYKMSERSRFFFNSTMAKHFENENDYGAGFLARMEVAARDASGNFIGRGAIIPGYTKEVTEWRGNTTNPEDNRASLNSTSLNKDAGTWHFQFGGTHDFAGVKVDYDAYNSNSKTVYVNQGNFEIRAYGVGMRIEDAPTRLAKARAKFTQISGPSIWDPRSYKDYNLFNIVDNVGEDNLKGAQLNVKKRFAAPVPTYIKTGVRVREQTRDTNSRPQQWSYIGSDIAKFWNPSYEDDLHGMYSNYGDLPIPTIPFRDNKGSTRDYTGYNIATALRESPQSFREDIVYNTAQRQANKRNFRETISAGYVMGSVDLGNLSMLGGIRVEETEVWGKGTVRVIAPAERARRAAWVGPVTDEESRRRINAEFADPFETTGKYKKLFPGMHFKYEPKPIKGLVFRGSWATNIGRAAIGTLVPTVNANYDTQTVSVNNPKLKPQFADNFDLAAEYYFEPVGMLSAGVFLKEIRDFIFTDTSQRVGSGTNNGFDGYYENFVLQTQSNGGRARVRGFELAYQQQFTFLPGWWQGFSAYANYTRLQTKGDYLGIPNVSVTNEVAGFRPVTANAGISYSRSGHSLSIQANYIGRFLSSYSADLSLLQWTNAGPQIDVKSVYRINSKLDAYLDVWNLFSMRAWGELYGGRPRSSSRMDYMIHAGLRARF